MNIPVQSLYKGFGRFKFPDIWKSDFIIPKKFSAMALSRQLPFETYFVLYDVLPGAYGSCSVGIAIPGQNGE